MNKLMKSQLKKSSPPKSSGDIELLDQIQRPDLPKIIDYLAEFWLYQSKHRIKQRVREAIEDADLPDIKGEHIPVKSTPIEKIFEEINHKVLPNAVRTSHPLFLGYVTPPSLDICALGDAIASVLNQNVAFQDLSPVGTAIEGVVIRWLCEIIGFQGGAGGVMVSGGSAANLYGLTLARRKKLSEVAQEVGSSNNRLRIYCSEETHRSVHKAAMLLGIGSDNVKGVPVDSQHRVRTAEMRSIIKKDRMDPNLLPMAIVGACGTRLTGAFDDLDALADIAGKYKLWFHVDAAYGGFLKLIEGPLNFLNGLARAQSVTLDPHKLLFVPFDCGCLLVKDNKSLMDTFGGEREYEIKTHAPNRDYANLGMQLGRSMKALKVWLALKYIGIERYGQEFSRLLQLAQYLVSRIQSDDQLELLAPVAGIVVCFRWKGKPGVRPQDLGNVNKEIRLRLLDTGEAFLNRVEIDGKIGLRLCLSNFRTERSHLDYLLQRIHFHAKEMS